MQKGITLVELLVTLSIIGVLLSFALPSYQQHKLQRYRAQGQGILLQHAVAQKEFSLDNSHYANTDQLRMPPTARYEYDVVEATANRFKLRATAQNNQTADVGCEVMMIDQSGVGTPVHCW